MSAHLWQPDATFDGEPTRRCAVCGACAHWPIAERPCGGSDNVDLSARERRAVELHRAGANYNQVAIALDVSRQHARNIVLAAQLKLSKAGDRAVIAGYPVANRVMHKSMPEHANQQRKGASS
jgi:hypothetical protein